MDSTVRRTVVVASQVGLHARPASIFAQAAQRCEVPVTIGRPGQEAVDAASMLQVMGLGVQLGEPVTVTATGLGAQEAVDRLAEVLATDLDSA